MTSQPWARWFDKIDLGDEAGIEAELRRLLVDFDHHHVTRLGERATAARRLIYDVTGTPRLRREIVAAYRALERKGGTRIAVAVRRFGDSRGPARYQICRIA